MLLWTISSKPIIFRIGIKSGELDAPLLNITTDSLIANQDQDPDRWKQVMADWEGRINNEINDRKQRLSSLDEKERRRVENEIDRLEKQKQRMTFQKEMTERRLDQEKTKTEQRLNQEKDRTNRRLGRKEEK